MLRYVSGRRAGHRAPRGIHTQNETRGESRDTEARGPRRRHRPVSGFRHAAPVVANSRSSLSNPAALPRAVVHHCCTSAATLRFIHIRPQHMNAAAKPIPDPSPPGRASLAGLTPPEPGGVRIFCSASAHHTSGQLATVATVAGPRASLSLRSLSAISPLSLLPTSSGTAGRAG